MEECAENDAFTQKIAYLDTLIEASHKRARRLNEGDGTVAARAAAAAQLAADIAAERATSQDQIKRMMNEILGKRAPVEATQTPNPPAAPTEESGILARFKKYFS